MTTGRSERVAEGRDPVFAVMGGRAQYRFGESRPHKTRELRAAAQFFYPEIERIGWMRVDQNRSDSGTSEHRGRSRARKPAADDRYVDVPHPNPCPETPVLRRERQIKA